MHLRNIISSGINFFTNNSYSLGSKIFLMLFVFLIILITPLLHAQWVNNPEQNTKLVVDAVNPINISAVSDLKGGSFIFWQDNRDGFQTDVYFLHADGNGNASFRADGKILSSLNGDKANPVPVNSGANSVVVVWRELKGNYGDNLFAQKVQSNGSLLWSNKGIKLTNIKQNITDFSVDSDNKGFTYTSFVTKDPQLIDGYKIGYQKISPDGNLLIDSSARWVYKSGSNKIGSSIINDGVGGAYILWIESVNNNSIVYGQHIDSSGNATWGKKPLPLSETSSTVISFSSANLDSNTIYFAYQTLKGGKKIRHQLVTKKGTLLWGKNGKEVSKLKSVQTNPQVVIWNNEIILGWADELSGDKDIHIQKYDTKGKNLWKEGGLPVLTQKGNQFGQKLLSDGYGGAIIAWIDRRVENARGNLYGQRINNKGEKVWDADGLPIASFSNSEKSYLSLVSDTKGGVLVVFREIRGNKPAIYAQKIFNTGTYISQILGFKTELVGDSVKILWYSANVTRNSYYEIERSASSDTGSTAWSTIGTIRPDESKNADVYQFYDKPDTTGTIYYRVVQRDANGNLQPSDVARITVLGNSNQVVVGQNTPNPFNKETVIKFFLPRASTVNVEFFNNHVEKVYEIKNADYPAGENEITFSADGLTPGIYFYRFKSGDYVEVKKMVVTE
ncbi:MAG: T9SS type A sorting domain-containing protein [Ignavibacteriaceae bacterium]|nr:T9SS type A sorting domain-containing protein [Ignavibacteriaceae bacterium]